MVFWTWAHERAPLNSHGQYLKTVAPIFTTVGLLILCRKNVFRAVITGR